MTAFYETIERPLVSVVAAMECQGIKVDRAPWPSCRRISRGASPSSSRRFFALSATRSTSGRPPNGLFDPAAVEERFDLSGPAKILMPFGVDLQTKELRWYDVNLGAAGYGHNVARYGGRLGLMAATLEEVHGSGDRVSLWEICCWHAAARPMRSRSGAPTDRWSATSGSVRGHRNLRAPGNGPVGG